MLTVTFLFFHAIYAADVHFKIEEKLPEPEYYQIRPSNDGQDIVKTLDGLTGIMPTITSIGAGPINFKLRNLGSEHYLILVDGVEMNDSATPAGMANFHGIPVESITKIEVLKGSYTAQFGPRAHAGVIKITTTGVNRHKAGTSINSFGAANVHYLQTKKKDNFFISWDQARNQSKNSKLLTKAAKGFEVKNTDFLFSGEYLYQDSLGVFPHALTPLSDAQVLHRFYQGQLDTKSYFLNDDLEMSFRANHQNSARKYLNSNYNGKKTELRLQGLYHFNSENQVELGIDKALRSRASGNWDNWGYDLSLDSQLNYQGIIDYQILESTKLFYKQGRSLKDPTDFQKNSIYGNKDLQDEQLHTYELSGNYIMNQSNEISMALFYNDFDNKIDFKDSRYFNKNAQITKGFDLSWKTHLSVITYTYQNKNEHIMRGNFNYHINDKFEFVPSFKSTNKYQIFDLKISYDNKKDDSIFLTVNNVFNSSYALNDYNPGLGRYIILGYNLYL